MSFNLILNSTNITGNTNSSFTYNFIGGGFEVKDDYEVCLSQVTLPYSFFNVSTFYGNNSLQINYPRPGTANQFDPLPILLPNGNYSTTQITEYIQSAMIAQGMYLTNAQGQNIYFVQIVPNSVYYADQILCFPVPTAAEIAAQGLITPANWYGSPSAAFCPQVNINNAAFGALIGYTPGAYPPGIVTTTYSTLSNTTPNASPVNALVVQMNICRNAVASPPNILASFPINATFGSNINFNPTIESFVDISPGKYNSFSLTIVDQNFQTVAFQDVNVLITLIVRKRKQV